MTARGLSESWTHHASSLPDKADSSKNRLPLAHCFPVFYVSVPTAEISITARRVPLWDAIISYNGSVELGPAVRRFNIVAGR